jgi:Fe-Mn family superoxide dismutase
MQNFTLPELPYGYKDLEPFMSEAQLTIHHQKHHQAYVTGANNIINKLQQARIDNADIDIKAASKELTFHMGGWKLHSLFWQVMAPVGKGGGGEPTGKLAVSILKTFGSFARFKKEFSQAALSCEGSGWAALTYSKKIDTLIIVQMEKHNVYFPAGNPLIMTLDVWEHAYYLDYKNDRAKYIDGFWNVVNWQYLNTRFEKNFK